MKKPSKSYLIKKLDAAFAKYIKRIGVCQRCGKSSPLNCAHVYSRARMSVRFDADNAFCLCVADHFWAHKNPIDFTEWVKEMLGQERYDALRVKANTIVKWTIEEMQAHLKGLEEA